MGSSADAVTLYGPRGENLAGGVGGGGFSHATRVQRISEPVAPRGAAVLAKAVSDFGALGEAMSDNAIASALYNEYRAWQQTLLRDAAIHWWLYKANPWVRACVDLIAQRATADDFDIESASGNDTAVEALRTYLDRLNPTQSLERILRGLYRDLQINANWYARCQFAPNLRGKRAAPVALYRVDFRLIVPRPEPYGPPKIYHLYRNGRTDYAPEVIPAEEIIHITLNDAGENGCGLSPLESLDFTLANDQAAVQYNTSFFQNGAKAGDIYRADPTMSADQVERERLYLKQNFTKPSQSFEPLLLQGGMELLREGAGLRKDMEFVKLREWNREETCAVYSVPLSLVTGQVGALGANGKESDRELLDEGTVAPLQKQVFEDIQRELIEKRLGQDDLTLVAPKMNRIRLEHVQMANEMIKTGATGNESRRVMGLDDRDGLDEPLYLGGRNTSLVGEPGSEDSVLLTDKGAIRATIQDPPDLSAAPTALPEPEPEDAPPDSPSLPAPKNAPVAKARGETAPKWLREEVAKTMDKLSENANSRRRHLTRLIGAQE